MSEIYIHHHLGLGDHIICNGLVRRLSEGYDKVNIFCKQHNYTSVKWLYDYDTKFNVIPLYDESDVNKYEKVLKIGFHELGKLMTETNCTWDECFYKQLNVPFSERWDNFFVNRGSNEIDLFNKLELTQGDYILIHGSGSDNIIRLNYDYIEPNDNKIHISPEYTDNIFDYCYMIENAKEIHCVDSSFKHLCDSLSTKAKLFYHNVKHRRSEAPHQHKKNWIIV